MRLNQRWYNVFFNVVRNVFWLARAKGHADLSLCNSHAISFLTYETEFVLFLVMLENSVLSMGWDSSHETLKVTSELLISKVMSLLPPWKTLNDVWKMWLCDVKCQKWKKWRMVSNNFYCHCIRKMNKRDMMALNRSPEFNSSNPKSSAAELFGTWGHHLSKLRRAQLCNPLYRISSIWAKLYWNCRFFSYCLPVCISTLQTQELLAYGHFRPSDLDLNKIGKGPLGNAIYLISSIWGKWFWRQRFFNNFSMIQT